MIAVLGYVAILTGLGAAGVLAVAGVRAARGPVPAPSLRPVALTVLVSGIATFVLLEIAILTHDYSIAYVARNSADATPLLFLFASGWAALEGSIVLWSLVLAGFTYLVVRRVGPQDLLGAGAAAVLGGVGVFWFGMMATVSNPFAICTEVANGVCAATSAIPLGAAVAPLDGLGPNPLLQNHILMAVHPPMLYVGFVGFTVPFAFAIAAMARGEQGRAWLDRTHRWSAVAWSFLTLGLVLGAWWSYEVLGWGGYWAWDPVENAAFLPWLVGTAFLHSAVVQRRRGMLQAWNLILVVATFGLTILGTFLTRSGVIASVHSFTQSAVGPALLGFLLVVLLGSLGLFAMRAHLVAQSPRLESLASREGAFLLNNLVLALFAFTVLVGTLYPLVFEGFTGRQVSVGRPFFDRVTLPLAFVLLLAVGVGSVSPYRVAKADVVWPRIRSPLNTGLVAGALAVLVGVRSVPVVIVIVLATFVVGVAVRQYASEVGVVRRRGVPVSAAMGRVLGRDRGYWGGQIAHTGLALVAVAVAASTALAVRTDVRLTAGDTVPVAGYCLTYEGPFTRNEPHRVVEGAEIRVLDESCEAELAVLEPRVSRFPNVLQPVASPAVRTGLVEDLYLSVAGGSADELVLDVFVFPLMWMLWLGGLVVVAGGLWSSTARRHRTERTEPQTAAGSAVSP